MDAEFDASFFEDCCVVWRRKECANGPTKRDCVVTDDVLSNRCCRLECKVLVANRRLRCETRRLIAKCAFDALDGIVEFIACVGTDSDEQCLVEDTSPTLDSIVRRRSLVCPLLEIPTSNALFEVGIDLEVISDLLEFASSTQLILRSNVGCEVEFDIC